MERSGSNGNLLADRVLVVDDDVQFHKLAEAALTEAGFQSICVRSAEEAERLMTGAKPLAVLVDGLLPGVRGDELARRLRSRHPRTSLPIVFVSAFFRDMKSYRHLTQACGVDLVLHKPVTVAQLRAAVDKLLQPAPFPTTAPANEVVHDASLDLAAADLDIEAEIDRILFDGDEEDESPEMLQLRAEYLSISVERVRELRQALERLTGVGAEDALHLMRVEGHRFAGSGASFGYDEISRLGRKIEELIVSDDLLHRSGKKRALLTGLVEALADKVSMAAGSAPIPVERRVMRMARRVLLLDREDTALFAAAKAAADGATPIDVTADVDEALHQAIELRPDAVFVAAELAEPAVIERLRSGTSAQIVVVGERDSLQHWMTLLRAGAVGFVPRPPDTDALFRLATVFARPRTTADALAVGANPVALSELAEVLAPRGVAVHPCTDTAEFFATLEREAPSLVILDGDLEEAGALDLLRVLRADVSHRRVAAIILTEKSDPEERRQCFEAGANGYLERPFEAEELGVRVAGLLATQSVQSLAQRDALTGLFDRGYLVEACDRALQLGRREGRQVALLGFDLCLEPVRKEQGRLAADGALMDAASRLLAAFRSSDVVARVGSGRMAVLLHGAGAEDAERLLAATIQELGKTTAGGRELQVRGAYAAFPGVIGGADALLGTVEKELAS